MQDTLTNTLQLRDGRMLGYALLGDPQGRPAFFFHGFPGSRLTWRHLDDTCRRLGLFVIAPDRPGYGLSSFQPRRKLLDWPDDVLALAAALGIQRFSVLGISGGGPYVAACAFKIPDRLKAAVIVSGQGPLDVPGMRERMSPRVRGLFNLAKSAPFMVRFLFSSMTNLAKTEPEEFVKQAVEGYGEPDRKLILGSEALQEMIIESYVEGFRQGPRGASYEARLFARPWRFRLEDIQAAVYLWQGEEDTETPPAMGSYLSRTIPNCQATFCPDEGHFSVFTHHFEEITAVL